MSNSILESELTLHTRPAEIIQPRFSATGNCLGITVAGLCRQPDSSPFQSWKVPMSHVGHQQQNTAQVPVTQHLSHWKTSPLGIAFTPSFVHEQGLGKFKSLCFRSGIGAGSTASPAVNCFILAFWDIFAIRFL